MNYDHRVSTGALLILVVIMLMVLPPFWVGRLLLALASALAVGAILAFAIRRQERR